MKAALQKASAIGRIAAICHRLSTRAAVFPGAVTRKAFVEIPVSFESAGEQIVGMMHLPSSRRKSPCVVLCHGFTGHKGETHFLFVKMSRALARKGIASLRFDFRGSGDSEGDFRDVTISAEIADALKAVDFVAAQKRVDAKRIGILGLSLGGCVAACVAGRDQRVKSLALWSAVAAPAKLFKTRWSEQQIASWRKTGGMDIGGLELGLCFLDDLPNNDPAAAIRQCQAPVLIIHGRKDESVPVAHADVYLAEARRRGIRAEKFILPGADHVFRRLDWERTVIEKTARWFVETL
ncbi:MAG: alpha/beta fold hydrolase [Planctomycetes bacterium]|nr:alpha/beta fold hydrolase [Planctomycetota bacterium]